MTHKKIGQVLRVIRRIDAAAGDVGLPSVETVQAGAGGCQVQSKSWLSLYLPLNV